MPLWFSNVVKRMVPEWVRASGSMTGVGIGIIAFFTIVAVLAPAISPYDPVKPSVPKEYWGTPLPPSLDHPMGTTHLGYDILSRLIWGTRTVLVVISLSTIVSMSIGVPLGLVSGYFGGRLDRLLSMVMDSIYAFPGIVLAIAIASVLGPSPTNAAIALAIVYVPTYYRIIRGQVLELRESLFVEALKGLGLPDRVIIVRHLLPNVAPSVLVVFGLASADAILTEAGLSFFGLIVSYPYPDWGLDLYYGKKFLLSGAWWMSLFPGLAIMLLALGFALLGEGLSERYLIRGTR